MFGSALITFIRSNSVLTFNLSLKLIPFAYFMLFGWLLLLLELFPCFSVGSSELPALITLPDLVPLSERELLCQLIVPFQSICFAAWKLEKIGLRLVLVFVGLQGEDLL